MFLALLVFPGAARALVEPVKVRAMGFLRKALKWVDANMTELGTGRGTTRGTRLRRLQKRGIGYEEGATRGRTGMARASQSARDLQQSQR